MTCVLSPKFTPHVFLKEVLELMNDENIDLILHGGFPFPAPPAENPPKLLPAILYVGLYNLLNFPVGSMPFTKENETDQVYRDQTG